MRLDRCSKFVLGSAVALVGVRMVHFEPFLIAAFDFLRRRIRRKTECLKCLGFQHLEFAYLEISLLRLALRGGFAGIQCLCRTGTDSGRDRSFGSLIDAGPPGRTAAGGRFPLIAGNVRVR